MQAFWIFVHNKNFLETIIILSVFQQKNLFNIQNDI